MQIDFQVSHGDPFYREIAFQDQYDNVVDFTGWVLSADFKTSFAGPALLALTTGQGIGFRNEDPTTGVVYLSFDSGELDLDLTVIPRNGERVPFKFIIGDLKLQPPDGVAFAFQDQGARTAIFIKVLAGVTP